MSARLRRARVADAAAVAQVHAESWQVAYAGVLPRSYLATLRPEPLARYWARRLRRGEPMHVATVRGALVGFSLVGAGQAQSFGGRLGELFMLYVRPSHWRRGLGAALFAESMALLEEAGAYWLHVWVLAENRAAQGFYAGRGLRPDGARRRDVFDGERVEVERWAMALNRVWPPRDAGA
ncbi:MAG TPA: GNAT family N-acetyltransferase [Polyangiaceae bacterium LLY-WYZ-15_(1-7)]|nr:GNAT family N-acetyltransferase [Sandaracinus sp.]HJL06046.1 GNAT family N-acetyltransferase [Polyangiaceae bacterium LLY-WYZ-15_(1-7)]MBJ71817.1 GNAT family N-acetyltransferase [Sandaracinus sp.]HJL10227.1 GNAT family N-acetyltransferase [Polyangiaceae bacterium LLY-WYZ-15_(1-7)]HJL20726.1 GNAT family N-acetyltransferase [Polyangiaceae bacterium LLY-WYZ-15_(1-7)]